MSQWLDSHIGTGFILVKLLYNIDVCIGCMVDGVICGSMVSDDTYWCLEWSLYGHIPRRSELHRTVFLVPFVKYTYLR